MLVILGGPEGLSHDGIQRWYHGKLGIEQIPEDGDAFGETLASGDFDTTAPSAPRLGRPAAAHAGSEFRARSWMLAHRC